MNALNTMLNAAIAAFALLALGTEQSHQGELPSFPGVLEVRASIPGRMRMGIPMLRDAPEKVSEMRKTLLETGVFREITVNPVTESVLFTYDADKIEPAVLEGVVIRLLGLEQAVETRPASTVQQGITAICQALDNGVYDATGGLVSGKMAAVLALAAAALKKGLTEGVSLPGAATLIWWVSGLIRKDGGRA